MSNLKTLLFYPALAPYRIDLFNRLAEELDFKVIFLQDQIPYHRQLDQQNLKGLLKCSYDVIRSGITIRNRTFHLRLWHEISKFRPDATVTVEYSFATMCALLYRDIIGRKKMGLTILTTDNPRLLLCRKGPRNLASRLGNTIADSILVYTEQIRQTIAKQGVLVEKIFVCANHQRESSFANKLEQARGLVEKTVQDHNLTGKKILLFVGRLVRPKGLDRTICAFAKATQNNPNCIFVLIGNGPQQSALEDLADRVNIRNRVLFLGHLEGAELLVWYLLAGATVLCSDSETYGAVVNEALLAGVPVLCSSYAGAHVLIEEGKNGCVFDPYDVETLVSLIKKTLYDVPTADVAGRMQRTNLMPVPFERDVKGFTDAVQYAAVKERKA